ncbi:MAG TPA: acetolactate synthase large subunit, partial [Arthrobacter bacterium]|nr:acetolactate synthase large subunit [Arthrobacter sp.]
LLITLGARFDDRVTGILKSFAPHAKVIHADIDPAEISKNRAADVPIVGSVKEIIPELTEAVRSQFESAGTPDLTTWWAFLNNLKE